MPKNGDINKELGVYKNFCCGAEMAILEGDRFPGCRTHDKHPTRWKRIIDDKRFVNLFHVRLDRCVAFLLEEVGLESWEEAHLIRCIS
jgi:hypothetical protein